MCPLLIWDNVRHLHIGETKLVIGYIALNVRSVNGNLELFLYSLYELVETFAHFRSSMYCIRVCDPFDSKNNRYTYLVTKKQYYLYQTLCSRYIRNNVAT